MRVFTVLALVVVIFGIFFSSASRSEETSQTDNIKEPSLKEGTDVENDEEIDDTFESRHAVSKSDENDEEEEENDNIESNSLAERDDTFESKDAVSKSDENDEEEEENDDNIESNSLVESDNKVENIKATSDEEDTPGQFKRFPWRRRRRRRWRIRIRGRRVVRKIKKICKWVKILAPGSGYEWKCRLVGADEENTPKEINSEKRQEALTDKNLAQIEKNEASKDETSEQ